MKKLSLLLILGFALAWSANAQTPTPSDTLPGCGVTGDFLERNIDPQLLKQMNAQWQRNKGKGTLSANDPIIYIPVMFHIVHLGEPIGVGSNLSEGQIQASLATLNNIFRARGKYAGVNDTRIEFVLANCSGVDRADASGVPEYASQGVVLNNGNQQQQIQQLFGPFQDKFVNIYVVHRIDQAGGFASFGGRMFITLYDFPKTNERSSSSLTFAHEIGHVLFLAHTFNGDNSGYPPNPNTTVCPPNDNPLVDGDQVADTPPHRVFDLNYNTPATDINYCTSQPFGIGLVKNHMAYYTSADRFTPGQIARMRFHLENYLTKWTDSDAVPTPNNQITLTSVPSVLCANVAVTVNFTNNSGSTNPVLLLSKGDEVVNYVENANSPVIFNVPVNVHNLNYNTLEEGDDYRISIVAGCNSAASNPVTYNNIDLYSLAVVGADGEPFANTYQNAYQNLCNGSALTLKAGLTYSANGVNRQLTDVELANFNFQWTLNGNAISGATGASYAANGVGGTYRYVLSRLDCANQSKVSYFASLNYNSYSNSYISDYQAIGNPLRTQCAGNTIKLQASYASNTATYQWYKDGVLLHAQTGRILLAGSSGSYRVVPSDGGCQISTSDNDKIAVSLADKLENYITAPSDSIACNGLYLYGPATGQSYGNTWAAGLTYQWLRNGQEILGATSNGYFTSQAGTYSLKLRQGTCESVSSGKRIYTADKNQKPIISAPASFASGITYRIYLENTGSNGFQWFKDDQPIFGYNYLDVSSSGVYEVRKGYNDCAIDSDPLTIVFGSTLSPGILADNVVNLACSNGNYSPYLRLDYRFYANTSGLTFRWMKDGADLPLSNYYADKNYIYQTESGLYQLRVTNGSASGVSNGIAITSSSNVILPITALNEVKDACDNNVVKLSFLQTLVYNANLVWRKDGIILSNQSSNTLAATQSGTYTATYQGNGCTVTSEPITVTIGGPLPTATLSGHYAIRSGETANLQLASSAQGPYFFTLSDGTEYLGQALTMPVPKSPIESTTYALTSFGTHCGLSPSASGLARIDVTNCAIGVVNATLSGGTWTTPGIWSCGSIPTALDLVRINASHTVTLPDNYPANVKSLELLGTIQQSLNAGLKVGQE
ncbi:M43 family zinc metalloprotease [Persicitalea sp.]|uniref:M43 family zinc metalloprotease n=1 Tax=Persicitalea sp. TaxID=3100273 RepID=UPI0035949222